MDVSLHSMNNQELSDNITAACQWVPVVKEEMGKVLVGQADLVDRLLVGLLCKGHDRAGKDGSGRR